jgi:hypothetical protein
MGAPHFSLWRISYLKCKPVIRRKEGCYFKGKKLISCSWLAANSWSVRQVQGHFSFSLMERPYVPPRTSAALFSNLTPEEKHKGGEEKAEAVDYPLITFSWF